MASKYYSPTSWFKIPDMPGEYYISIGDIKFIDAYEECRTRGGYMVNIENQNENAALAKFFAAHYTAVSAWWLGATNSFLTSQTPASKENWQWLTSGKILLKDVAYANWCSDQPDDKIGNEHCMMLFMDRQCWGDVDCKAEWAIKQNFGVICEKKSEDLECSCTSQLTCRVESGMILSIE